MNYLAHFYLSHETESAIVGSILGDFVKGSLDNAEYSASIKRAIQLHREIDSFTDHHECVLASKQRLSKPYRRYGGILLDIFFDHFLAKHWFTHHKIALDNFSSHIYVVLNKHCSTFPSRLQRLVPYMIEEDWLASYVEIENIARALNGVSRRLSRDNPLASGVIELIDNYENLEKDYFEFFAALLEYVCARKKLLTSNL